MTEQERTHAMAQGRGPVLYTGTRAVSAGRQTRLVELQRQIKVAVDALRAVERSLARELGTGTSLEPHDLAARVREGTRNVVMASKNR